MTVLLTVQSPFFLRLNSFPGTFIQVWLQCWCLIRPVLESGRCTFVAYITKNQSQCRHLQLFHWEDKGQLPLCRLACPLLKPSSSSSSSVLSRKRTHPQFRSSWWHRTRSCTGSKWTFHNATELYWLVPYWITVMWQPSKVLNNQPQTATFAYDTLFLLHVSIRQSDELPSFQRVKVPRLEGTISARPTWYRDWPSSCHWTMLLLSSTPWGRHDAMDVSPVTVAAAGVIKIICLSRRDGVRASLIAVPRGVV